MAINSFFLIALISVTVLLVAFIIILLITGKHNKGKIVLDMMKKKKSLDEVLQFGLKKEWKDREIRLYYLLYTMQDFQKSGYNLDEVESMAIDGGWPKDLVQIVIEKLK